MEIIPLSDITFDPQTARPLSLFIDPFTGWATRDLLATSVEENCGHLAIRAPDVRSGGESGRS